ncbi:MAG: amino acid adenylation domain-containing protein [Cyanobacteriota bacterium ELA615]
MHKRYFVIEKENFSTIKEPLTEFVALNQKHDDSFSTIFLTTWIILLYRYRSEPEITIGYQKQYGILPINISITGTDNSLKLLEQVKKSILLSDIDSQNNKYPILFAIEDQLLENFADQKIPDFDLRLSFSLQENAIHANLEYNENLFKSEKIDQMITHFQTLIEKILKEPTKEIDKLELLTSEEKQLILRDWNQTKTDYPNDKCIHQLFEQQVIKTPEAIAVIFENQSLTYQQLNNRANQLAHYLISLGVKPETLVGICLERSLEMIVGLLGILKAGGAYVPLDPNYPNERLAYILEDSAVEILLTQEWLLESLPQNTTQLVCLDRDWETIEQFSRNNPETSVSSKNLAYVIYTSGSTGQPKGVLVLHKGVVRLVKQTNYIDLTNKEVLLQLAPISFDASTWEIWGSLLNGAKLVIFPNQEPSLQTLANVLKKYEVTTLWLTVGLFNLMVDEKLEDLKDLKHLLAGGDALSTVHVQKALSELTNCQLINGYGPTENTTFTCCYPVRNSDQILNSVPIGRPISNTQIYILDSYLQPVPIGVTGELHIGGDGLARGYLNKPELTQEKFINNPFGEGRLYISGDLARYLPDGNIEYLGRIDTQVKIRGFRIELGEIETTLNNHPQIQQAVVIAREDNPGDKKLVAYIVNNEETIEPKELRNYLQEKLPEFMVPSFFVNLERLPLTPNGKIDRRALPIPKIDFTSYSEPSSENEKTIAKIWAELLNLEKVGIDDNFFNIGGNSLLAVSLFQKIEKNFGIILPVSTLFRSPTIRELTKRLEQENEYSCLVPLQIQGSRSPLFLIHACNGEVAIYRNLAKNLGKDIPVYGLQAVGLDGQQEPDQTVEVMASRYLKEIKAIQPKGPYYFGGKHIGALIALEMTKQLMLQGEKTELLIFFGRFSRIPYPRFTQPWLKRQLKVVVQRGPDYVFNRIKQLSIGKKNLENPKRDFYQQITEKMGLINAGLLASYILPMKYEGNTIVIQPVENFNEYWQKRDSKRLIDFSLKFPNSKIIYVPGTDMIDYTAYIEPNIKILCQRLREHLS